MAENQKRLEAQLNSLTAVKADYENRFAAMGGDHARLSAEYSAVKAQLAATLAAKLSREAELAGALRDFKTESGNRARFEAELKFLKQDNGKPK